jgi:predicted RNA-binding Zn-ribbon protein involved in translation (DUF1610 family)
MASSLPVCPACNFELSPEFTRKSRFACPKCEAKLQPVRSDNYRLIRKIVCWSAILIWGWTNQHDASFVFFISAYAVPVFAAWHLLASYFPAKRFELADSYIQTLGIDPPRSGFSN